jgi:hypothetical protein
MNLNHSRAYSKTLHRKNSAGIALLSVLWVLLLLSALAATAMYVARTNAILTHRALELAQAEAAADAAIVDTISKLSDEQASRHPPIDGTARPWEFGGAQVTVSIANESGRIDVNSADRDLISAFLQSQGLPADTASSLIDELRAAPPTDNMPRRRALEATEELTRIPSWRAQDLDCWMISLTVYTGLPGVSVADATPATLAVLQWAKGHHLGNDQWVAEASPTSKPSVGRSMLGEVLRIRAMARVSKDVAVTSEWVGRITGDRRKPMLTMRWDHENKDAAPRCRPPT